MHEQTASVLEWRGEEMVDADGDKIGKIDEIYLDVETDKPEWALVNTGLFGTRSSFVPLKGASPSEDGIRVPYSKDQVKDAPNVDADEELSQSQEADLYRHYGVDFASGGSGTGTTGTGTTGTTGGTTGTTGQETTGQGPAGRDTGSTDDAMTRSEEEVDIHKTREEVGRARLRKYIVTDEVTKTVPVQREEVRVEREPVTEANRGDATGGPALSEDEHEVTLHEEHVDVDKHVEPKERVRLDKDTVTEQEHVDEEVRKERIEVDDEARR